jgi:hypothetical protein
MRRVPLFLVVVLAWALAASVSAQSVTRPGEEWSEDLPPLRGLSGQVTLLGANMVLSGLTGGVLRWHGGGSFLRGFGEGALGGAAIYAGKAMVARGGDGLPFVGRQVAAAGGSVVRNVGAGQSALEELTFPVGPLRVHVSPRSGQAARLSADLLGIAGLVTVLVVHDVSVDWSATLTSAAPVLIAADPNDELSFNGRHVAGTILVRDRYRDLGPDRYAEALAHERVHLLQYDQFALLWSAPVETALLGSWGWTRRLEPHVDLGLHGALAPLLRLLPGHSNPLELEANFLADTW